MKFHAKSIWHKYLVSFNFFLSYESLKFWLDSPFIDSWQWSADVLIKFNKQQRFCAELTCCQLWFVTIIINFDVPFASVSYEKVTPKWRAFRIKLVTRFPKITCLIYFRWKINELKKVNYFELDTSICSTLFSYTFRCEENGNKRGSGLQDLHKLKLWKEEY